MWTEQPLEKELNKALKKQFRDEGDNYYAHYQDARNYLLKEIYPNIPAAEPNLTDHTERHIQNVQKNVNFILTGQYKNVAAMDLYLLALMVLFHDVGNIHGRDEHYRYEVIAKVYDTHFGDDPQYRQERRLIAQGAEAHSGTARDGSTDTLKDLDEVSNIDGHPVRLREMAAILRFADELAEGPQRTSSYMQKHGMYAPGSKIFHEYANITNVQIDRGTERIALTFNIRLRSNNGKLDTVEEAELRELLSFTYKRVNKLDQERKYARHYSLYCNDFKRTTVAVNIERNGKQVIDLKDCVLNDIILPGVDKSPSIESVFKKYSINSIVKTVNRS